MAGIFQLATAKLKAGLTALMEPAADPRQAFADPQIRQQELLTRVREALAQNSALRERLERRCIQLAKQLPQLETTARKAVAEGREEAARLMLQQRQLAVAELKALESCVREVRLEESRIGLIEQRLSAQMEALRVRQEMATVRYTAAESQVLAHEALSGISKELGDLDAAIEQAEEKTETMQARAMAIDELTQANEFRFPAAAVNDTLRPGEANQEIELLLTAMKAQRTGQAEAPE